MNKKYQIFVSSTYEDLKEQRESVIKAILEMGHIPVGMEMFSAADEQQWSIIKNQIDGSDYYIVIVAHRYGSMDGETSFTEKEYDYATSQGIPTLGFAIENSVAWHVDLIEKSPDKKIRLETFKEKIKKKPIGFWSNSEELYAKASIALMKAFTSNPRIGYVRSSEVPGADVLSELTRLSTENSDLRSELEKLKRKQANYDEDEIDLLILTLININRPVSIYFEKGSEFSNIGSFSLMRIFVEMALEMVGEGSYEKITRRVAFALSGKTNYRKDHPLPANFVKSWIADLTALELIRPSEKRHSVKDSNEYYMLTELGSNLVKHYRRKILLDKNWTPIPQENKLPPK